MGSEQLFRPARSSNLNNYSDPVFPDALADGCALSIRDAFADYHARFAQITRRARSHFENRDWSAARADAVARIALYDKCVQEISQALESHLGTRAQDRALWSGIRDRYAALVAPLLDQELYKTFFNTLTRRFFKTRGVAADVEFVALDIEPTDRITVPVARHSYAVSGPLVDTFERVLADFPFAPGYADARGDAERLATAWNERTEDAAAAPALALELLQTVFYRERRAYLVGRIFQRERYMPCVIALVNGAGGVRVDALLTTRHHVAVLFGYAHSYFHADLGTVGDAVVFLRTLLPGKPLDEIYTVLGRAKQGKTERYRHFFRYLQAHPEEKLRHADGERGMVMAVFTLPGYPLVFKVIRDEFGWPKQSDRGEVQAKYSLVFMHDRVGRLIDAQEYRHLRFPKRQFEKELLDELLRECRHGVSADGEDIVVHHCYVERRLRPLNLYVRETSDAVAMAAILDYGQAIKDLACSNIFPGDLLFKNFGATRHGRAVFYDYDELCLVQECRFRPLPQPSNDEEEMHHGAWYHVADADVFPEQFPRFLGMTETQRAVLLQVHGEIFQVQWWQALQAKLATGELVDVPPYPESLRLRPDPAAQNV